MTRYKQEHKNGIFYDSPGKRQKASNRFVPEYISTNPESFLEHLRGQNLISSYRKGPEWDGVLLEDADSVTSVRLKDDVMSAVMLGITEKKWSTSLTIA